MSIKDLVEKHLLYHTTWIHATVIAFATIVLVNGTNEKNWSNYFYYLFALMLIFSPQLLFTFFRNKIHATFNRTWHLFIWSFCFLLVPAILSLLQIHQLLKVENVNLNASFIPVIAGSILLVEIILLSNDFLLNKTLQINWIKKFNLEKSILLLMAILSIGIFLLEILLSEENTGIAAAKNPFSFFSYSFQFFIILLIYYTFYWINHYILISKIFKTKGIIYYTFGFAATLFFLFPIAAEIISWLPIVHQHQMHPAADEHPFSGIHFLIPLAGMLMSTPIILTVQWFKQNSEIAALEQQKSSTELRLLKQQINPHFFFNTLNNLYALSLTKDEKTPEVILQLSELMRYVIKKGKEDTVTIKEEIKYIEDYIWLQQIRLHKQLDYSFEQDIEDPALSIPPLLFINLVENAFKHGIEPAEKDCFLKIKLKSTEKKLSFECINSVEEKTNSSNGTGLKNIRRRLALRFPSKHTFNTTAEQDQFKAEIILNL